MKKYVYHRLPEKMDGDVVFPLNTMEKMFPDIFAKEVQKYHGREVLREREICTLGCLWNDVIHMTPVHPKEVRRHLRECGVRADFAGQFIKVDIDCLAQECLTLMAYEHFHFTFCDVNSVPWERICHIPMCTRAYYQECAQKDVRPILFHGVAHVLYKGCIDIHEHNIITV